MVFLGGVILVVLGEVFLEGVVLESVEDLEVLGVVGLVVLLEAEGLVGVGVLLEDLGARVGVGLVEPLGVLRVVLVGVAVLAVLGEDLGVLLEEAAGNFIILFSFLRL